MHKEEALFVCLELPFCVPVWCAPIPIPCLAVSHTHHFHTNTYTRHMSAFVTKRELTTFYFFIHNHSRIIGHSH